MRNFTKLALCAAFTACVAGSIGSLPAKAEDAGAHPYYRHALADLRRAHGFLNPGGDNQLVTDEDAAQNAIEAAIGDIKKAGVDDGKPMNVGVTPNATLDHVGRLHHARQEEANALRDATKEEQNLAARGLQRRASIDIRIAIKATDRAIAACAGGKCHEMDTHKGYHQTH